MLNAMFTKINIMQNRLKVSQTTCNLKAEHSKI